MTPAATVLVPTHDHGPTLLRSVRSALAQTVQDLEVFVVGDGVPDVTRECMAELTSEDERVRFFDQPKGPRHGEIHRHEALQEARGEIVCYLADDDLLLPGHVEHLRELLAEADFAHSKPFWINADGGVRPLLVDLGRPSYLEMHLAGENRIPLSCGAHTLAHYRRLPAGWRTTPDGTPTDLYMWQQILSAPGMRAVSGNRPTVLHFPSPARTEWSIDERLAELDAWFERLADPGLEAELDGLIAEALERDLAWYRGQLEWHQGEEARARSDAERLQTELHALTADRASLAARVAELDAETLRLTARIEELGTQLVDVDAERALFDQRLAELSSSVTWRLRARLVGLPVVGALIRLAARALAPRAGP